MRAATAPATSVRALALRLLCVPWLAASAASGEGTAATSSAEPRVKENENVRHSNVNDGDARLPHIVMIVVDDLGSHDLGLHGTGIRTPHIDGFVGGGGDGIYLDDYYVLPDCTPTRAALLSGMYPLRTGLHGPLPMDATAGLPLDVETLPEMLQRAAPTYQTHAVGKWHLGHSSWEQTPTFRGFDSFFGFYGGMEHYFAHEHDGLYDLHYDASPRCGKGCSQVVDERGNYSTHVFTREAIKVVRDHSERFGGKTPLFLYLAYQAVHCPAMVPLKYSASYRNRTDWTDERITYAGMLTAADEGVGNLTAALKEAGLWEDTLVVVTTDNGGPTTVGCTQGSSNHPKRGGKCSLWEGGTTGDALLAGPALGKLLGGSKTKRAIRENGTARSFSRFEHLFHVVDWFPTLAEWVGVAPANLTAMDGVSQARALADGGGPARTELFGGYALLTDFHKDTTHWWGPSLRHLNWKLVQGTTGGPDDKDNLPQNTGEIVPPGSSKEYLLFDLNGDPREETDLSEAHPEVLQKMVRRLKMYQKYFVPPQILKDPSCKWPGFEHVNMSIVGPAHIPWCKHPPQESTIAFE